MKADWSRFEGGCGEGVWGGGGGRGGGGAEKIDKSRSMCSEGAKIFTENNNNAQVLLKNEKKGIVRAICKCIFRGVPTV